MTRAGEQPVVSATAAGAAGLVLYPTAQEFPYRRVVRRARILADRDQITIVGPGGTPTRSFPVRRDGGVFDAVHVGVDAGRRRPASAVRHAVDGDLDLRDRDKNLVATIPLAGWFPEQADTPRGWNARMERDLMADTGLAGWCHTAGLKVRKAHTYNHPLVAGTEDAARRRDVDFVREDAPWQIRWLYGFSTAALVVMVLSAVAHWLIVVSGLLLLSGTVLALGWVGGQRLLDWVSRPRPVAQLRPHPTGRATPRFRHTARVLTTGDDIVFVDTMGAERWLPLGRPTGPATARGPVERCVILRPDHSNQPAAVEFRRADGRPGAVLAWPDWFAGPGGPEALQTFAHDAGLPLTEEATAPAPSALATYGRLDRDTIADRLYRRPSYLGGLSPIYTVWTMGALFSFFFLNPFFGTVMTIAAGLGAAALTLSVLPGLLARTWRIWWDRPR